MKFLERNKLPTLTQEEIKYLRKLVISKEIKLVVKNLPTKKSAGQDGFTDEFYETLEELTVVLLRLFQIIEHDGILLNPFYEARFMYRFNTIPTKIPACFLKIQTILL